MFREREKVNTASKLQQLKHRDFTLLQTAATAIAAQEFLVAEQGNYIAKTGFQTCLFY